MVSLHFCSSDAWGGLELYAATLMVELNSAGVEVVAICKPKSKMEQFLQSKGIRCEYLPNYRKLSFSSFSDIRNFIEKLNIDILHVHFHRDVWMASIALRNDRVRKLYLSVYMGVNSKRDILHRWVYRRVDAIFSSSQELNARLHTLYPVPKDKIHFLPYGRQIDNYSIDEVKRKAIRERLQVGDNEILVGSISRIDPGKGVMDFTRSFLYLDNSLQSRVKYIIIGEPTRKRHLKTDGSPFEPHCEEYLQEIKSFITEKNLEKRIFLLGYQDDLIGYLSALDVFIFPSRDELYSLVVLDAMSMGLPVVASRAGGNLQQIEDGKNGLLYIVADSKDLANKLSTYIKSPDLRKQHGHAARQFVEKTHNMKNTIHLLKNFYVMNRSGMYK